MNNYTEKELIDFANYCIYRRQNIEDLIRDRGVSDAELSNWKESLIKLRRDAKLEEILKTINDNDTKY